MPIVADTKNWTWVLDRACPECGLDTREVDPHEVATLLRENAEEWVSLLGADDDADLRRRPSHDRWSALEYACHVRDVFVLFHHRLLLMLSEDDPRFDNWDQDATATEKLYGEQDPDAVAAALGAAADQLCARFSSLDETGWARTGVRSDGARFSVATFARYLLHDPVHHLWDVGVGRA